jgi:hypothetical protein
MRGTGFYRQSSAEAEIHVNRWLGGEGPCNLREGPKTGLGGVVMMVVMVVMSVSERWARERKHQHQQCSSNYLLHGSILARGLFPADES